MSAVVDAAVVAVLFTRDPRFEPARALFAQEDVLHAPAGVVVQAAEALRALAQGAGRARLDDVEAYLGNELPERLQLHHDHTLVGDALELAAHLDLPVASCLALALALRRGERLYTFDRTLLARLAATRFATAAEEPV